MSIYTTGTNNFMFNYLIFIFMKENKVEKLSFFKKKRLIRRLKNYDFVSLESCTALIESLSKQEFQRNLKLLRSTCCNAALNVLLAPHNKEKLEIAASSLDLMNLLQKNIFQKGDKEQLRLLLRSKVKLASALFIKLISEYPFEYFSLYCEEKELISSELCLLLSYKPKWLEEYFKNSSNSRTICISLSDLREFEKQLFCVGSEELKQLYIKSFSEYGNEGRLYFLENATDDEIAEFLKKDCIFSQSDEFNALLKRGNSVLITTALINFYQSNDKLPQLSVDDEVMLIKSGFNDALAFYLPKTELFTKSEIELIKLGNLELLKLYLTRGNPQGKFVLKLDNEAEEALFESCFTEVKKVYTNTFGLSYCFERALIATNDIDKLSNYIEKYELRSLNQAKLVAEAPMIVIKQHILKYGLSQLAEITLIKKGSSGVRAFYLEKAVNDKRQLCAKAEKILFQSGTKEELVPYLAEFGQKLYKEAVTALLYRGDKELLEVYLKYNEFSEDDVALFVKTGDKAAIRTLFLIGEFEFKAEKALILRADEALFSEYISLYKMTVDAEIFLMQHGAFYFIKSYIDKHQLSFEGESELIEHGNFNLIEEYTSRYELSLGAEMLLCSLI